MWSYGHHFFMKKTISTLTIQGAGAFTAAFRPQKPLQLSAALRAPKKLRRQQSWRQQALAKVRKVVV